MDSGQSIVYKRRYRSEWITESIPLESVYMIRAEDKYITVYHDHGTSLLSITLKTMEATYSCLYRIHRKTLVNVNRILSILSFWKARSHYGHVVFDWDTSAISQSMPDSIKPAIARARWKGLWKAYRRVKENGNV